MIEVQGLSHYYGDRRAVDDVSFSIADNEVIGFLGLNGAGKSTTLKVLGGILNPTKGDVRIDGVDVTSAPMSFRARIGYLPEEPPLYREMAVEEFLRFVGGINGMSKAALDARLPIVLARANLQGTERRVIAELSHGFKKRVGIAQAIIHKPRLVILDEPISGLDPVQIVEMRQVVRDLRLESTVLVSSHILGEISQTCDRILVLHQGRLVARGTEAELRMKTGTGTNILAEPRGSLEAVKGFLAAHPTVVSHQIAKSEDGVHTVRAVLKEDRREELVKGLVQADIGVRRFEDALDELEEIFLGLTKEGAA
jgi:ABC-2 type transport system ATP-binding protein